MDSETVRSTAQRFIDALHTLEQASAQDVEELVDLFADNSRLVNSALKLTGEEHTGRQGAREFWAQYRRNFGEVRSEFYQITVNDEAAGLFWTSKGTYNDGEPLEYDGVSLLVFDQAGKIALFRGYYDTREISRAAGATTGTAQHRS